MKIHILTQIDLDNYGTQLQAYAMQKMSKNPLHEVETCSYYPARTLTHITPQKIYYFLQRNGILNVVVKECIHIIMKLRTPIKINPFFEFRQTHIVTSPQIYATSEELQQNPPYADIYIAGSDNIWGGRTETGVGQINLPYYLTFVPNGKRKIAYAASMGNPQLTEAQKEPFLKLLDNFDYISVRGKSTADYLTILSGKEIVNCLDPTLLLTESDWDTAFPEIANTDTETPYILVYVIYPLPKKSYIYTFAKQLSKQNGLKITYIGFHYKNGLPNNINVPVIDFLRQFRNASSIITNSFHGTLFSLIFRKNFYTFPPIGFETRITDMLASIDLSSRYVHTVKEAESLPIEIDYMIPEQKLNELREFSMTWLDNAINSEKSTEAAS